VRPNKKRVAVLLLLLAPSFGTAQEITVAAASDLQFVMDGLAKQFHKETGKTVRPIYGSSGNFFQQLQNGAPFDMFFSANLDYPKQLEVAGITEPGTSYPYARGRIVIWVPTTSKLDLASGLQALLNPSIEKIAIANPQHAPYGQAAVAAMKKENLYEKIKDKFVFGENISQTASFVISGSADVGIIALSLALAPNMRDKGRYAEIPIDDYPPLEQACVIMKSSLRKDVARAFLNFVKTPAAVNLFRNSGFTVPDNRTATER
jgi:molybdate transport system substrate-binding protein